jgi:hypothetical protein
MPTGMSNPERDVPLPSREILERKPGRSFSDPSRPLGEELISRADPHGGDPDEGVYGRAAEEHYRLGHGVPERAKCVAVLRKADELMAENNPPADTDETRRRALELACGRCGVRIEEYDRLVDNDEEIKALQSLVLEAARLRAMALRDLRREEERLT